MEYSEDLMKAAKTAIKAAIMLEESLNQLDEEIAAYTGTVGCGSDLDVIVQDTADTIDHLYQVSDDKVRGLIEAILQTVKW